MSKFGTVPPEPHRQNALDICAPKFAERVMRVLHLMQAQSFDPYIFETLRTPERQAWLAGFGRDYDDGRGYVTHATDVFTSWHGFGLAADIISDSQGWDTSAAFKAAIKEACDDAGLVWGGDWRMKDYPHVQLGAPLRTSPSSRAKELFDEGGLAAVWQEVGASA